MQNPAQRHYLGLEDDDRGILVSTVIDAGPCGKVLEKGDVILSIDGHSIASDAFVDYEGGRVQMPEVVERKFKGDTVKLELVRDKQPMSVDIKLGSVWPYFMQGHSYDIRPRYVVYGGLLFQPMSLDLLEAYRISDLRVRHAFDFFVSEQIYRDHPEIIILTNILPDPINTYLTPFRSAIVDEINGQKIKTLQDLARAFEQPADRFVVKMIGDGPPLVPIQKRWRSPREN